MNNQVPNTSPTWIDMWAIKMEVPIETSESIRLKAIVCHWGQEVSDQGGVDLYQNKEMSD